MKFKKYILLPCILLMPSLLSAQNCDYLEEASGNCFIFSNPYGGLDLWNEQFFPTVGIHNCTEGSVWELIFSDEFNGNALDQQKWLPNYPYGSYVECEPNIAVSPNNYNNVSSGTKLTERT